MPFFATRVFYNLQECALIWTFLCDDDDMSKLRGVDCSALLCTYHSAGADISSVLVFNSQLQ